MLSIIAALFLLFAPRVSLSQAPEAFHFVVAAPVIDSEAGRETWSAFVRPDTTAEVARLGPAAFRIRLDNSTTKHRNGMSVGGVLIRGDSGGATFFNLEFGPKFMPAKGPGNSGMLAMSLEPLDSLPFTATVRDTGERNEPWIALVKLRNGGQFILVLDRVKQTGEFRQIPQYNLQVLSAVEGLFTPR